MSRIQNVQLPNVELQNVQDTKRPGRKTSSFVNLKTCYKKNRGRRPGILDAVHALSDVVVKLGARLRLVNVRFVTGHFVAGRYVTGPFAGVPYKAREF
jgi:hypothetical protein